MANRVAIVAIGFAVMTVVGGAAAYVTMHDSISRLDVGDDPAMRQVQTLLMPSSGCGMLYRTHVRMSNDQVLITPCKDGPARSVHVPAGWQYPDLVFEAKRDATNRWWRIYVDKDMPVATVVAAMTQLAPAVVAAH